jgi:threonylcarbamoyladenosine tRNA methylthiotransferase MtaB
LESHEGRQVDVLVEHEGIGRTPQFAEISLDSGIAAGAFVRARVTGHDHRRLSGEVLA